MQIHNIKSKTQRKKSVQVGRGGKRGKTSGRGTKGQGARAGRKIRPELRDTIKRFPKLRGRGVNQNKSIQVKPVVVYLSALSVFNAQDKVSPLTLAEKGIIKVYKGKLPKVKILIDNNESEVKLASLKISNCEISAKAKDIVEKAGGLVK